jgi:hypothetical protein
VQQVKWDHLNTLLKKAQTDNGRWNTKNEKNQHIKSEEHWHAKRTGLAS